VILQAFTRDIDLPQIVFTIFALFFVGLVVYLRREDKREGYPLVSEYPDRVTVEGFPRTPAPKTFLLPHGGTEQAPRDRPEPPHRALAAAQPWFGAPLEPTDDPMLDGIGPAAYANRADTPERTYEGETRMAPLRVATAFFLEPTDPDPRGMTVIGADNAAAGVVKDVWIDRTEPSIRYLEVALAGSEETVLLPASFANAILGGRRQEVTVSAITAAQFAKVPRLKNPDQVTMLEEDRITAYYAGGYMFATPLRREPLI